MKEWENADIKLDVCLNNSEESNLFLRAFYEELNKHGKDVFVGPCSPEIEDENGEFIPYSNPNVKGIWKKSTNVEVEIYKGILKKQQEENKTRKLA